MCGSDHQGNKTTATETILSVQNLTRLGARRAGES